MRTKFNFTRRQWLASAFGLLGIAISSPLLAQTKIRRIPPQYIAALAPEGATSGTGAETWGLWKVDPGPIGVWLRLYQALQKAGNIAPAGWRFDIDDWWLDENGLIMKAPEFPIPPGQYYVTNGEGNISLLTVEEPDAERLQLLRRQRAAARAGRALRAARREHQRHRLAGEGARPRCASKGPS